LIEEQCSDASWIAARMVDLTCSCFLYTLPSMGLLNIVV